MTNLDPARKKVRAAIRWALNELGRRSVLDIRQSIGIRVGYSGNEVIRSEPGESPRYEFGNLSRAIKYKVKSKAETVEDLTVYVNKDQEIKAMALEFGRDDGSLEPRPFWVPAQKRLNRAGKRLFTQLVKERLRMKANEASDFVVDF